MGWRVQQVDVTIVAEKPKISSHRELMKARLAPALGVQRRRRQRERKDERGHGMDRARRGHRVHRRRHDRVRRVVRRACSTKARDFAFNSIGSAII